MSLILITSLDLCIDTVRRNLMLTTLGAKRVKVSTFEGTSSRDIMAATGQEMVREKNFFNVREMSGNFILGQGRKVREN